MSTTVRVDVPWAKIAAELKANGITAQKMLDYQVLKDSNPFVPRDTGTLMNSGVRATHFGAGQVVWQTPYAGYQYYGYPNKSRDVHPQATMYWFEASKRLNLKKWLMVAKRLGGKR